MEPSLRLVSVICLFRLHVKGGRDVTRLAVAGTATFFFSFFGSFSFSSDVKEKKKKKKQQTEEETGGRADRR